MTKALSQCWRFIAAKPRRPYLPIRCLQTTSSWNERQRPSASSKPADDDYYSLLLSSPLPTAASSVRAPTPPGPRNTTSQPPTPTETQTKPPGPRNTSTNTAQRDARVIFGSRLAGPAAAREQQGWAEARPAEPDNCCMSGCVNCVWDLYREEMEEWAARKRKAHVGFVAGEADKARKMRGRGKRKEGEVQAEGGVGDIDDGGAGSFEGMDVAQEGLFEGVPVGIREFMNTEKRLRERREARGADIVEREHPPTELEQEIGSEGNEGPEWQLYISEKVKTYNRYYLILDSGANGDYLEKESEVDLYAMSESGTGLGDEELLDIFGTPPSQTTLSTLQSLLQHSPIAFSKAVRILADGSRNEDRRDAYGDTGLLDYMMEIQTTSPDDETRREALRMVANACADNDSNRDRVIASPYLKNMFKNLLIRSTAYVTLAALYNISLDYELAQQALRENGLFLHLIALLDNPIFDRPLMLHHTTGLLAFAIEDYDVSQSPDSVLKTLSQNITLGNPSIDEICSLRLAILEHLKQERFKQILFEHDLFGTLLVSILRSFGYRGDCTVSILEAFHPTPPLEDEVEDLEMLQTSLIASLRDVTSSPAFFERYAFGSTTTYKWICWLRSFNPSLQLMSCCVLSNYARAKEEWAEDLVTIYDAPLSLVHLSVQKSDLKVSLAALELLLQLARPRSNRARLCMQYLEKVPRIWTADASDSNGLARIQYASVAVLHGTISECPGAVHRLVIYPGLDPGGTSSNGYRTYLQALFACYERSNDTKLKTETAKVVMEICKTTTRATSLNAFSPREVETIWRNCLSVRPAFVDPIATVISQTDDPGLQAQGYLTLVLVIRQKPGVLMVQEVLQQRAVFQHLVQAITKQPVSGLNGFPGPPENFIPVRWRDLQRAAHENARCLVSAVLSEKDPQLAPDWSALLDDLAHGRFNSTDALVNRAMSLEENKSKV